MKTCLLFALTPFLHSHEVTFEIISSRHQNTLTFSTEKTDSAINFSTGTLLADLTFDKDRTRITSFHFAGGRYYGSPFQLSIDFGKPPLSLIFKAGPTRIGTTPFSPSLITGPGLDPGTGILAPEAHYWFTNEGQLKGSLSKLKQVYKDFKNEPESQLFNGTLQVEFTTRPLDEVSDLITLTLSNTLDHSWEYVASESYGPDDPGLKVSMTSKGTTLALATLVLPKIEWQAQ